MNPNLNKSQNFGIERNFIAKFFTLVFYALSIQYVLMEYAAPNWPDKSFLYEDPTVVGYIILLLQMALISAFSPSVPDRPSTFVLGIVQIFVIIPICIAAICMEAFATRSYYVLSMTVVVCYVACCIINRINSPIVWDTEEFRLPHHSFMTVFITLSIVLAAYLVYRFYSIMSLVGLDSLYVQRSLGMATNLFDGYAQIYSQYVLSTGLVAMGLYRRSLIFIVLGLSGTLLNFSITAEKAGALFPIFIVGLYIVLGPKAKIFNSFSAFALGFGLVNFVSASMYIYSDAIETICINFGTRSTVIPGSHVMHYYEFFSARGFTYFSNVRGLDFLIPTPDSYIRDPRWPKMGLIVGEDYLGISTLNANINFVGYDGIAGYGVPGIVFPFVILLLMIKAFDSVAKGIPLRLSLPLLVPIALTLSNSSIFTVLTSFGGFFWLAAFKWMFAANRRSPMPARGERFPKSGKPGAIHPS